MHVKCQNVTTVNPPYLRCGGGGGGGGSSINLEKTMVSALHRELQNQVEKLKYKKV